MKQTKPVSGKADPSRTRRRPRRAITTEDKTRMALRRFELDSSGRFRSVEQVAQLEGREVAVVSRAISSAFVERLVEIQRVRVSPVSADRDVALEERLKRRYWLRGVIVVQDAAPEGEDSRDRSNRLHWRLGWAMAELIASGTLFRDSDRIGVGSGRGVFCTVESLCRKLPLPVRNVTIGSLTGSVYATDHSGDYTHSLDADNSASHFSGCFTAEAHTRYVSHPIAFGNPKALQDAKDRTWLSDVEWTRESRPTHALIGVGVFTPGHRLHEEATSSHKNPLLTPNEEFAVSVRGLADLCDDVRALHPHYCPVMDLCNRFFFVEPPAGVNLSSDTKRDVLALLERLNERLLTVTSKQLSDIDTIMLVAGGANKALIIWNLLNDRTRYPYNIQYLCTDSETARSLLQD